MAMSVQLRDDYDAACLRLVSSHGNSPVEADSWSFQSTRTKPRQIVPSRLSSPALTRP